MHFKFASAAILLVATPAFAQLTPYGSQADFLAATAATGLEDFNDESLVPNMDGGTIATSSFTISSDASELAVLAGSSFGNLNGSQFFNGFVNTDPGEDTITVTFPSPVTAFGGTFGGPSSGSGVALEVGGTRALSSFDYLTGGANGFLGFTSTTPFTSVDIVRSGDNTTFGEIFGLDNVFFTAVPEPTSLALLGLGGLALLRRRR